MPRNQTLLESASLRALQQARHKGWLAGVALRLGSSMPARNPYSKGSEEHVYWEAGFDEGLAG